MKWQAALALSFVRIGFVRLRAYRLSNIFNALSAMIFVTIQYFLWQAIYQSRANIGLSFRQMFLYVVLSQVIFTFLPSHTSEYYSRLIESGDIVHRLLKPCGLIKQFFFESIGDSLFCLCYVSVPILVFILMVFHVQLNAGEWSKVMPCVLLLSLSYCFVFMFESIIGICSFYTLNTWGLQSLKYAACALLSGRFLPLSLYPDCVARVVDILPFKMMYFWPLSYLLWNDGQALWKMVCQQIAWNLAALAILVFFLRLSLRRLLIQGG